MTAYNAVNGHTMSESPLLRDVLKDEWGFDGLVMSDWGAARTTEPAARAALDLAMPGPHGPWGDALVEAVRDGRVPEVGDRRQGRCGSCAWPRASARSTAWSRRRRRRRGRSE